MLKLDLCDYSNSRIALKRRITVNVNTRNEKLTFKNNALFRSSESKISNTFIDNAEDPDTIIPMYILLEYSDNYSMTLGNFWKYYRNDKKSC